MAVCERWHDFTNFLADMGLRPEGTTIDRIDNDGDYTPDNCRWATLTEQANNKRSNRRVEWCGETKTVAEWARELGFDQHTLKGRFFRGWSTERALTTKTRNRTAPIRLTHDGLTLSVQGWSDRTGIPPKTLRDRVFKHGWAVERALTTKPHGSR